MPIRCSWPGDDAEMVGYHDLEWGVPVTGERELFAALTLESAQAGLSWRTILARREGYRAVFLDWDVDRVAGVSDGEHVGWYVDARIVRHRQKIDATVANARAIVGLRADGSSLADVVWGYAEASLRRGPGDVIPADTSDARALSRQLKSLGFRFVGPKIVYAFMQAVGVVNDHQAACFRHDSVEALRAPILSGVARPTDGDRP